jgi:C4-dicarboxylate-specific signal transduction histidine kinase
LSDLPEPIEKALAQTNETQAKLASGVQELAVTNAVLQQEIPEEVRTGDVALAIEKNEALENRVQECVDDLEDVSQALSKEVARRKQLEKKLKEAGVTPPDNTTV